MIVLSVDTTSQSYAFGQVFGTVALAVVALVLVWILTSTWRNPSSYGTAGPDETAAEVEAAARAEAGVLAGRPIPAPVKISSYDKGGDTLLHALFILNSTTCEPDLADQKAGESISQEFLNFFTVREHTT